MHDKTGKLEEGMSETKEFKDRIAVLTIAYHNLAVEQEFLHMVSNYTSFGFEEHVLYHVILFFSIKKQLQVIDRLVILRSSIWARKMQSART
jgi:hypothetical protein